MVKFLFHSCISIVGGSRESSVVSYELHFTLRMIEPVALSLVGYGASSNDKGDLSELDVVVVVGIVAVVVVVVMTSL